jgi:hypothetical protein
MAQQDIYSLDNILIPVGWALSLLSVSLVGIFALLDASALMIAAIILSPVFILIAGYLIRSLEKRYIALWRIVENRGEVGVRELKHSLGLSEADLKKGLRAINATGKAYLVWDDANQTIEDGRLRYSTIPALNCPQCGATEKERIAIEVNRHPSCRYCGAAYPPELVADARRRLYGEVKPGPGADDPPSRFKVAPFVLLCIFFWPGAIAYYFATR